ncbi:17.5 kDa class I heat shock protein [Acorus calamus]|uniref:17.5 kDa class I heat shock protein n=1 Tax=Acorus calamus TaxID=4465 RepID=A0AAV9DD09_ACOCL|nr:17.5 kDa class I heat shock protein [Acorus calamus]
MWFMPHLPLSPPVHQNNSYAYSDAWDPHSETAETHVFTFELPGVKKGQVKVSVVDGRVLEVIAEREVEKTEENDTWHLVERVRGRFWHKIRLPEGARVEQMKAVMEDGVLTVTVTVPVPKVVVKEPGVKPIDISG